MPDEIRTEETAGACPRCVPCAALWPLKVLGLAVGWVLIALVRAYQLCISPLLPPMCRYQPSCSQYMIEAIRKKGPVVGLVKGLWRLMRCNPLFPGGYDPVEKPGPAPPDSLGGGSG